MKKINLYLIRKNYGWGHYGDWELVMLDEGESIYDKIAEENPDVPRYEGESNYMVAISLYDIKEVDYERLAALSI